MNLFYREIAPTNKSAHIALNFWQFTAEGESGESITHEVFPDGCISLVYHQNIRLKIEQNLIIGLSLTSTPRLVYSGDKFWAVRISPAAGREIFGVNPALIQTQPIDFTDQSLKNLKGVFSLLKSCEDFTQAIEKIEDWIQEDFSAVEVDQRLLATVAILTETFGQEKISSIAERVGLSARQLQRKFLAASGLTPKQFARACRLRATAINLAENMQMNWANRAAEIGFADQAHLAHELQNITGQKPSDFAKTIRNIRHGELVK